MEKEFTKKSKNLYKIAKKRAESRQRQSTLLFCRTLYENADIK